VHPFFKKVGTSSKIGRLFFREKACFFRKKSMQKYPKVFQIGYNMVGKDEQVLRFCPKYELAKKPISLKNVSKTSVLLT